MPRSTDGAYWSNTFTGTRIIPARFSVVLTSISLKVALGLEDERPLRRAPDLASLPFDVVICRDQSRLYRRDDAPKYLRRLLRTGVKVAYYKDGRLVDLQNFRSLHAGVEGLVDSEYREQAKFNVRDGQADYAAKGYVCGGICYGYTNKPVMGESASGQPKRLYTDMSIQPDQGKIVVRIFKMFVAGHGPRVIAKTMNGDAAYAKLSRQFFYGKRPPKPMQGKRGSGSWAPSAIRDMLRNERYVGELVWGRAHKQEDEDGKPFRIKQPDPDKIVRVTRDDLRVVPPDLWKAAQRRVKAVNESYVRNGNGTLPWGRPESGRHSRHLLSGLARCGECGAALIAHKMSLGSGAKRKLVGHYVCSWNNKRGSTICRNNWRVRQDEFDQKVLRLIERDVLDPAQVQRAVKRAYDLAKERFKRDPTLRKNLQAELKRLEKEKENLTVLSAQRLDDPASVAKALNTRAQRIKAIQAELANLPDHYDPEKLESLKARMAGDIARFRDMMADRQNTPLARQVLRRLLVEPIKCVPISRDGKRDFAVKGRATTGALSSFKAHVAANSWRPHGDSNPGYRRERAMS
jgi:site-specific DNA recombinase